MPPAGSLAAPPDETLPESPPESYASPPLLVVLRQPERVVLPSGYGVDAALVGEVIPDGDNLRITRLHGYKVQVGRDGAVLIHGESERVLAGADAKEFAAYWRLTSAQLPLLTIDFVGWKR